MNFNTQDPILNIIAICKRQNVYTFHFAPLDQCILDHFSDLTPFNIEYYDYIKEYEFDLETIRESYILINEREDFTDVEMKFLFTPSVFIDFDTNVYSTRFSEQHLEYRVVKGWKGVYVNFLDIIPAEYQYWIVDGVDYSKFPPL